MMPLERTGAFTLACVAVLLVVALAMSSCRRLLFRHRLQARARRHRVQAQGLAYRSGRSPDWLKMKNPDAPAVKREAEEDWGKDRWRSR
jgi:hypothetical protein